jgi:predicted RNase H-like HicB family nuclease
MGKSRTQRFYTSEYRVELDWDAEDEIYVATVPELPGCATHGKTETEALKRAREAIGLYLETLLSEGKELPLPLSRQAFKGQFALRMPPELHRRLAIDAQREKTSLNQFIVKVRTVVKVYCVFTDLYSDNRALVRIFSTPEVAQEYVRINEKGNEARSDYEIEEWEIAHSCPKQWDPKQSQ